MQQQCGGHADPNDTPTHGTHSPGCKETGRALVILLSFSERVARSAMQQSYTRSVQVGRVADWLRASGWHTTACRAADAATTNSAAATLKRGSGWLVDHNRRRDRQRSGVAARPHRRKVVIFTARRQRPFRHRLGSVQAPQPSEGPAEYGRALVRRFEGGRGDILGRRYLERLKLAVDAIHLHGQLKQGRPAGRRRFRRCFRHHA